MEWKAYYDAELRSNESRDCITNWLCHAYGDHSLATAVDRRTVLSFPHTAINHSGPLQARVVAWLLQHGFERVITLGVMHGSLIPEFRRAADNETPSEERQVAIDQVAGAFSPASESLDTPFGSLAVESLPSGTPTVVRRDAANLLQREFSLDSFHAMLRLAPDILPVAPLSVLPVYVGMVRHPVTGTLGMASSLANWLREQWNDETAIVATGDVVHYGPFYGSEDEGTEVAALTNLFSRRLDELFAAAFVAHDLESAYQMSLRELKSDQREILSVVAYLLDEDAEASVEAFELSNYATILDTAPPCLVASALIAYKNRNARRSNNRVSEQESRLNEPNRPTLGE